MFDMKEYLLDTHLLVPMLRSSQRSNIKKTGRFGALVFHKYILFKQIFAFDLIFPAPNNSADIFSPEIRSEIM